jgi:CheY-like chemotaxis protein
VANEDRGKRPQTGPATAPGMMGAIKDFANTHLKRKPAEPPLALVVDDEEPVRKFVERALQSGGYRTVGASDGPDALAVAAKIGAFDVLVTDVMMPLMTGDELARRLRQTEGTLRVLYLTGFSDKLFKEKVTLWEDEAFLDKPCSVKALLQAVSLLLTGRLESKPDSAS